jgi:signal recognition particle subunit SEC65
MASIAGVSAPHPGQQQQYHGHGPPPIGPFGPNKLHSDPERFICIYPAYMNKLKSLSQGRRIAKEKAVENPNYQEIKMVLDEAGYTMGVDYHMEGKFYSRERSKEPIYRGKKSAKANLRVPRSVQDPAEAGRRGAVEGGVP